MKYNVILCSAASVMAAVAALIPPYTIFNGFMLLVSSTSAILAFMHSIRS